MWKSRSPPTHSGNPDSESRRGFLFVSIYHFPIFACNFVSMKELLTRTLSGAVLVALIIGSILLSPWAYAALMLFAVTVGTFEMANLQSVTDKTHRGFGLFF